MLSIKPDETRVVLIGTSEFPRDPKHLPELPAVKANIWDLASLLHDPDIVGIPADNIVSIVNEEKASDVQEKLAKVAKEATDTLLVYYSGHGLVGKTSSELYLATRSTTEAEAEFNAIPFANIRKAIFGSTAKKKILILDSCFSGRALQIMGSESSLLQSNLDLKGTFAMASAPANQPAMAPKGEKHTAFSGELIKVLQNGIDNDNKGLTLKDIFEHILTDFRRRTDVPEPQSANIQDADKIVFAKNQILSKDINKRLDALENSLTSFVSSQDINNLIDALENKITSFVSDQEKRFKQLTKESNSGSQESASYTDSPIKTVLSSIKFLVLGLLVSTLLIIWPSFALVGLGDLFNLERVSWTISIAFILATIELWILREAFISYHAGKSLWNEIWFPRWYNPLHGIRAAMGGLILLSILTLLMTN